MNEPKLSIIKSSRETSSSRPSQNHQRQGKQVLEIDDSSVMKGESDGKLSQIKADELLARKLEAELLQEQLNREAEANRVFSMPFLPIFFFFLVY